jgi:integrase
MSVRRDPRTGRWFFRTVAKSPDGRRRRIFGTPGIPGPFQDLAPTKVGAQEAERRAVVEVVIGRPAVQRQDPAMKEVQTIEKYAVTFLEKYGPDHKPSQRRSTRQIVNASVVPAVGHLRLDELRQEHVDTFVASEQKKGRSIKTINNRLAVLSTLLRYAVRNGVVAAHQPPLSFKIAGMVGEIEAVPMEDVSKLATAATDDRIRVAVLLAAEAGLRAGEIRGLQWGDVKDGQLTIRRAIDKDSATVIAPKHNKARTVPLSERLAAALDRLPRKGIWVVARDDGGAMPYNALVADVVALYERAKVNRPPKALHCLRHTFGTTVAGRGVPLPVLQALMGHADIKTTMRYVDVDEDQKRSAIAAVFSAAWQRRGSKSKRIARAPSK